MDLPWHPFQDEANVAPPWIRHSRLQTQQELCAKRFLRFASQLHVHAVVVLWALGSWRSGVCAWSAWAPLLYFTAPVLLKHRVLPNFSIEYLSVFILALNVANALHLSLVLAHEGALVLASPLFASVALCRVLFGLFTQEVHLHVLLSSGITLVTLWCNQAGRVILVTCLLLELTAVVVLSCGPCGYEEAMVHLAQCRLQHQLARSQALQRIDVEREELSGQLLSIATEGIAELTASVQRASEPVLNMLKAETSMAQLVQGEVNRAMEIADARMDLVRQSAQAMERRVSDTVEVLLSLLKYFRSKGCDGQAPASARRTLRTASSGSGSGSSRRREEASLPAIFEASQAGPEEIPSRSAEGPTEESRENEKDPGPGWLPPDQETRQLPGGRLLLLPRRRDPDAAPEPPAPPPEPPEPERLSCRGAQSPASQSEAPFSRGGVCVPRAVIERHPLFATRLCYRSEDFFFSWASSADFRAEADALRQWRRAAVLATPEGGTGSSETESGVRCWTSRRAEETEGSSSEPTEREENL
ncbi:unnamed protein product [Effrenium voratum]|nr:unnamed protein product [Effrenium voratum]